MIKLVREQNKLQPLPLLILLLGVMTKTNTYDLNAMALAGQLYMVAKLNSYGMEAEKDAEREGGGQHAGRAGQPGWQPAGPRGQTWQADDVAGDPGRARCRRV